MIDPPFVAGLLNPVEDDGPFWDFCRDRRLCFQSCLSCRLSQHPPMPVCTHCGSDRLEWREAPEQARIFSFTIAFTAAHPAYAGVPPYNIVVAEFPDLPGNVRLISNVLDAEPDQLRIGAPLRLEWVEVGEGRALPKFRVA